MHSNLENRRLRNKQNTAERERSRDSPRTAQSITTSDLQLLLHPSTTTPCVNPKQQNAARKNKNTKTKERSDEYSGLSRKAAKNTANKEIDQTFSNLYPLRLSAIMSTALCDINLDKNTLKTSSHSHTFKFFWSHLSLFMYRTLDALYHRTQLYKH